MAASNDGFADGPSMAEIEANLDLVLAQLDAVGENLAAAYVELAKGVIARNHKEPADTRLFTQFSKKSS